MLQAICIVILIKIGSSVKAREDIYAAVADLEDLLEAHKRVKDYLHFYIERHEKRLAVLKSYLEIFKREHEKAIKDLTNYLSDPVHVFTLMKRLTIDVYYIKRGIRDETGNIENITNNYNKGKYPTMVDLRGAANALLRLQVVYNLQVKDFSEGKLNSSIYRVHTIFISSTPMTACDCFEMGRALYQEKYFVNGLEWTLEAFRKYKEEEIHYSVSAFDIIEHISYGYSKTGDLKSSLEWIQKILNQDPHNSRAKQIEQICYTTMEDERYKTRANWVKDKEAEQRQLKANILAHYRLCRSGRDVPIATANRLTCRYLTENHPFSKLAPFKIEMLNLDPDIVLFYDVLSDNEIETVKKMAKCKNDSQFMQGNRFATVLFYMSEVTQGGATVFPNLGISVFPIKGAAIFWFNLLTSGEMHDAMVHIACPVLLGSKWVSTKWIHEIGQEFTKPCDLEQHKKGQYKYSYLLDKIH